MKKCFLLCTLAFSGNVFAEDPSNLQHFDQVCAVITNYNTRGEFKRVEEPRRDRLDQTIVSRLIQYQISKEDNMFNCTSTGLKLYLDVYFFKDFVSNHYVFNFQIKAAPDSYEKVNYPILWSDGTYGIGTNLDEVEKMSTGYALKAIDGFALHWQKTH